MLFLIWALIVYVVFAFFIPWISSLTSRPQFRNGRLIAVTALGPIRNFQLSIITYNHDFLDGEFASEFIAIGTKTAVFTNRKNEELKITSVSIDNRQYTENLERYPEVLKEAERVLKLGREKFQKVQERLDPLGALENKDSTAM
jgi:hypothetical protein